MSGMTAGAPAVVTDPKGLISPDLFGRLVARIVHEKHVSTEEAERVLHQALGFLMACALNPGAGLAPSKSVDVGWHAFVLHTREYADFCQRIAGRFIHHAPDDPSDAGSGGASIRATVAAMEQAGLHVDPDLWETAGDCSQCYQGCHDSPRTE
ncbi:hypothetical protein SAMN05443665_10491 [Actinomadura meyerae]|uniref:Uncharacterized protein n=1 Tax=Actinomadura meyerae TaxID=240840 RepID=A0A239NUT7_9ACTN|nr:hypothetical protein [Actinomadura meyerae]SNT58193.1 hypothetical protein SAMN05443665_10491 [Actinomadura meyerae]